MYVCIYIYYIPTIGYTVDNKGYYYLKTDFLGGIIVNLYLDLVWYS